MYFISIGFKATRSSIRLVRCDRRDSSRNLRSVARRCTRLISLPGDVDYAAKRTTMFCARSALKETTLFSRGDRPTASSNNKRPFRTGIMRNVDSYNRCNLRRDLIFARERCNELRTSLSANGQPRIAGSTDWSIVLAFGDRSSWYRARARIVLVVFQSCTRVIKFPLRYSSISAFLLIIVQIILEIVSISLPCCSLFNITLENPFGWINQVQVSCWWHSVNLFGWLEHLFGHIETRI